MVLHEGSSLTCRGKILPEYAQDDSDFFNDSVFFAFLRTFATAFVPSSTIALCIR